MTDSYMLMCGYGVCVSKVRIFSASTSAFYHFRDPHIRILPVAFPGWLYVRAAQYSYTINRLTLTFSTESCF